MWYNTVEFYVIAGTLAAAAVAFASAPRHRKPAQLQLLAGVLSVSEVEGALPAIEIRVDDDEMVHLKRTGLVGITELGAVSLAVSIVDRDISIEERLTPGHEAAPVDEASFVIDFLKPGRYHVKYNSEDAGVFTAFTLNVEPGIRFERILQS